MLKIWHDNILKFECEENIEFDDAGAEPVSKQSRVPTGTLMESFLAADQQHSLAELSHSRQRAWHVSSL